MPESSKTYGFSFRKNEEIMLAFEVNKKALAVAVVIGILYKASQNAKAANG